MRPGVWVVAVGLAASTYTSSFLSGEGFVTRFQGPGTIYVQTRSLKVRQRPTCTFVWHCSDYIRCAILTSQHCTHADATPCIIANEHGDATARLNLPACQSLAGNACACRFESASGGVGGRLPLGLCTPPSMILADRTPINAQLLTVPHLVLHRLLHAGPCNRAPALHAIRWRRRGRRCLTYESPERTHCKN